MGGRGSLWAVLGAAAVLCAPSGCSCGGGQGGVDPGQPRPDSGRDGGGDTGDPGDAGLQGDGPDGSDGWPDGWNDGAGGDGTGGDGTLGDGTGADGTGDGSGADGADGGPWAACEGAALDPGPGACDVPAPEVKDPPGTCKADADCDDRDPCTADSCAWQACDAAYACVHAEVAGCARPAPVAMDFAGLSLPSDRGWTVIDGGTAAACLWRLAGDAGGLGPDVHAVFEPSGAALSGVKSYLASPVLDASQCPLNAYNVTGATTVQWRMMYRHAEPGENVTLKVVAFAGDDLAGGRVLWSATTAADIAYGLHTQELPEALKAAPDLRLAFGVDVLSGTTAAVGSFQVDDVRLGCGVPNGLVRSKVYRCADGDDQCSFSRMVLVDQADAPAPVPALSAEACGRYRVILCLLDPDARYFTWQTFGFPAIFLDAPPLESPPGVTTALEVGQGSGCETSAFAVSSLCGVDTATPGYFFCAVNVQPACDAVPGTWQAGLVVQDEAYGDVPLSNPFQSLTRFTLTVPPPAVPDAAPDAADGGPDPS
jgi:hypothetical protein